MRGSWLGLALMTGACTRAPAPVTPAPVAPIAVAPASTRTLIVIGTNDLHGHLSALPVLGGYLANLRAEASRTGAVVLLVDAGDMFQGTLESNVVEGESIAKAYDLLGYAAAAVGNHEFDFGPLGPASTLARRPSAGNEPTSDPRGALRTRAREASFAFLLANAMQADGSPEQLADLAPVRSRTIVMSGGLRIGLTGVTSADTGSTTMAANVRDLAFGKPAIALRREAEALRREGATVVVGLAHAGSRCETFTGDASADRCQSAGEIFETANALPGGSIDVLVGGHTHYGVAHVVNDIPVIESYSYGRAFGRVDLKLDATGKVLGRQVYPPQFLCPETKLPADEKCVPGSYAGAPVVRDSRLASLVESYVSRTSVWRDAPVGVAFSAPVTLSYGSESALGNLFARLIREHAKADVGLMNGGALREDLPAGPLRYGQLFASMPFDNRIATATVSVGYLRELFAANLQSAHGILTVDGLSVEARCREGKLRVELYRSDATGAPRGRPLKDEIPLRLVASDFLLGGGDDFTKHAVPAAATGGRGGVTVTDEVMREAFERGLKGQGTVHPSRWYDPARPHVRYVGTRPMKCEQAAR